MRYLAILLFFLLVLPIFSQNEKKTLLTLSPKRGNHVGLEEVKVQLSSGCKAYYTTDGTQPSSSSNKVRGNSISLKGNTVFRFAIYDGKGNKFEETHTYIVARKVELPIISIISDPAVFFDSLEGIYVKGCCADTVHPYKGANFWKDWERKVYVEFFEPDGRLGFSHPLGIKIFGGYSKGMPQKSLSFYARKKHGKGKIKHPLFPQLPFKKYNNFILRNGGGDMRNAHIRDVFATQLIKETGLTIQEWRPVSVFINGEYWGKYNMREKINEHFISAHYGMHKDSVIIMRHNADKQHGDPKDYRKFIKELEKSDLRNREDLNYVASKMDIDNYLLYNAAQVYAGNKDAGGNIRYFKSTRDTGKWRWIYYDLDQTFGVNGPHDYKYNNLERFTQVNDETWPNPPWSTLIIRKLIENDSLKYRYINTFSDMIFTTFAPQRALTLLENLKQQMKEEIPFHLERWKVPLKRYNSSMAHIDSFVVNRPRYMLQHLASRFELDKMVEISIKMDSTKGKVKFNSLVLFKDFNGKYFSEIPQFIEVIPNTDFEFIGWENGIEISENGMYYFNEEKIILTPIFEEKKYSPFYGKIMFSEVDAFQINSLKSADWIELYNASSEEIDIGDWVFKDKKEQHSFTFPMNTKIQPKEFLILSKNKAKFQRAYPNIKNIVGDFNFGINIKSDVIRLYDSNLLKVDELSLKELNDFSDSTKNWVKMDYRIPYFHPLNWRLESPSPGQQSMAYAKILKEEKEDEKIKSWLIYFGIGLGFLSFIIFLVTLYYKNKKT